MLARYNSAIVQHYLPERRDKQPRGGVCPGSRQNLTFNYVYLLISSIEAQGNDIRSSHVSWSPCPDHSSLYVPLPSTFLLILSQIDYIVQGARYVIFEEYGCASAVAGIGMSDLLLDGWQILMPAISVFMYTRTCERISTFPLKS